MAPNENRRSERETHAKAAPETFAAAQKTKKHRRQEKLGNRYMQSDRNFSRVRGCQCIEFNMCSFICASSTAAKKPIFRNFSWESPADRGVRLAASMHFHLFESNNCHENAGWHKFSHKTFFTLLETLASLRIPP